LTATSDSKKTRIVETAITQLYQYGYNKFGFAPLAAECDIAKSSIIHHFPTKDALVLTAIRTYMDEEQRVLLELTREVSNPVERFSRYFDYAQSQMTRSNYLGCLAANLGLEISETHPQLRHEIQNFIEFKVGTFVSWIKEGTTQKLFRSDINARSSAESILTSLEGGIVTSKISKSPALLAIAVDVCRNIIRHLQANSN
jgi:TetR/AcrR family transcriptional repressor of nem operon